MSLSQRLLTLSEGGGNFRVPPRRQLLPEGSSGLGLPCTLCRCSLLCRAGACQQMTSWQLLRSLSTTGAAKPRLLSSIAQIELPRLCATRVVPESRMPWQTIVHLPPCQPLSACSGQPSAVRGRWFLCLGVLFSAPRRLCVQLKAGLCRFQ